MVCGRAPGSMRYEVQVRIEAPPEAVWRWWTDYGEPGHSEIVRHGLGRTRRLVLGREGDTIHLRESVFGLPVLRHSVTLHPERLAFREEARAFTAWWRFEPRGGGTVVRREIETRGWAPRRLVAWIAQRDLDHHAKEAESYLR